MTWIRLRFPYTVVGQPCGPASPAQGPTQRVLPLRGSTGSGHRGTQSPFLFCSLCQEDTEETSGLHRLSASANCTRHPSLSCRVSPAPQGHMGTRSALPRPSWSPGSKDARACSLQVFHCVDSLSAVPSHQLKATALPPCPEPGIS